MKIDIINISKYYGKVRALNNINLSLESGITGFLGPNGAGKTTLMQVLTAIIKPTKGSVCCEEFSWDKQLLVQRNVGYLPQVFNYYPKLTVREALLHIAIMKEIPIREANDKISGAINRVNLQEERNMQISKLSGGMLRRLGIAQAILSNPKILIVDEPTAGLDPHERVNFRQNLLLLKKYIPIIVISSHIVDDIESVCDRVVILNKGNLLVYDTPQKVAETVNGKVWIKHFQDDSYGNDNSQMKDVVDFKMEEGGVTIRIVSDCIPDNSIQVKPKLEDAYLYITQ